MPRVALSALLAALLALTSCPQRQAAPAPQAENPADAAAAQAPAEPEPTSLQPAELPLPVPVEAPRGSAALPQGQVRGRAVSAGMLEWVIPFAYSEGFHAAVADLDSQLAPLGFERVIGAFPDADPGYRPGLMKPERAEGRKTYISPDRRQVVRLEYTFVRGAEGEPDQETYKLRVLESAEPQRISEKSRVEPIG